MTSRAHTEGREPGSRPAGDGSRLRVSPAAAPEPVAMVILEVYERDELGRWITHIELVGDPDQGAPDPRELLEIARVIVNDLEAVNVGAN